MAKLYYCYEKDYPYFIRIAENGKDIRLPLDRYCREFTLDPDNIMLSREDFYRRLAAGTLEESPVSQGSLWEER